MVHLSNGQASGQGRTDITAFNHVSVTPGQPNTEAVPHATQAVQAHSA